MDGAERLGFIGLGTMGAPMAANLCRAGRRLVVWNRSAERAAPLRAIGAEIAADPEDVFARARLVFLMLADEAATDAVLGRASERFAPLVRGRVLVNMATVAPAYAQGLAADVARAGGSYVEAPVSGSRVPAEAGRLVAMLAGDDAAVARVRRLLAPLCAASVVCGAVPRALHMKLAVNLFMIGMVTALAEAVHFAERLQLDAAQLVAILDASPMASDVSRVKGAKLRDGDLGAQAAIANVLACTQLITRAARASGTAAPLIDVCDALFAEAHALGHERADIAAVVRAIEARTAAGNRAETADVAG